MALDQPWRLVDDHPRAVAEVRRWVDAACAELEAQHLAESVRLGASELVTNAVLHGTPPARVRLRGTPEHPRVEVADGSPALPQFPVPATPAEQDDLPTVGHGLLVVAGLASSWGAEVRPDGKVVWFTPAPPDAPDGAEPGSGPPRPVIQGATEQPEQPPHPEAYPVTLQQLPAAGLLAFRRHYLELRRELWLITVTHRAQYPTATEITALFEQFDRTGTGPHQLGHEHALMRDRTLPELSVAAPPETPGVAARLIELLDVADEFCRHHRLLALARPAEQVRFQRWYLQELARQADGADPVPWPRAE